MSGLFRRVAVAYKGVVAKRLQAAGLKYDDLLVETPDVMKAISRTSPEAKLERERRIKRAFDLSAKRKTLPVELAPEKPFELYLQQQAEIAKMEREERQLLDG